MNLLLDSHTFVWTHEEPRKLSPKVAAEIKSSANDLFLSVASVWELQIKIQIGKFKFDDPLENIIGEQQLINGIQILPVNLSHVLHLKNLPLITKTRSTGF